MIPPRPSGFGPWDDYLFGIADAVAAKSKDPKRKVGALIVDERRTIRATGYNGFPRGVVDDHRLHDREAKLGIIVHAEANAICAAARAGVPLDGCSLYCTRQPCSRCAGLIVQAGLVRVAFLTTPVSERWAADFALAEAILLEAGVAVQ